MDEAIIALAAMQLVEGFAGEGIESAGADIGLPVLVPKLGVALGDPMAKGRNKIPHILIQEPKRPPSTAHAETRSDEGPTKFTKGFVRAEPRCSGSVLLLEGLGDFGRCLCGLHEPFVALVFAVGCRRRGAPIGRW